MRHLAAVAVVVMLAAGLSACGGGGGGAGGGGGQDLGRELEAKVALGATVGTRCSAATAAEPETELASGTTDSEGRARLQGLPVEPLILSCSGGSYFNEATGLFQAVPPGARVRAAVASTQKAAAVTPFTTIVAEALLAGSAATRNDARIAELQARVAAALLPGLDIGRPPATVSSATPALGTDADSLYAAALGGFALLAADGGRSVFELTALLVNDILVDGTLDGRGSNGIPIAAYESFGALVGALVDSIQAYAQESGNPDTAAADESRRAQHSLGTPVILPERVPPPVVPDPTPDPTPDPKPDPDPHPEPLHEPDPVVIELPPGTPAPVAHVALLPGVVTATQATQNALTSISAKRIGFSSGAGQLRGLAEGTILIVANRAVRVELVEDLGSAINLYVTEPTIEEVFQELSYIGAEIVSPQPVSPAKYRKLMGPAAGKSSSCSSPSSETTTNPARYNYRYRIACTVTPAVGSSFTVTGSVDFSDVLREVDIRIIDPSPRAQARLAWNARGVIDVAGQLSVSETTRIPIIGFPSTVTVGPGLNIGLDLLVFLEVRANGEIRLFSRLEIPVVVDAQASVTASPFAVQLDNNSALGFDSSLDAQAEATLGVGLGVTTSLKALQYELTPLDLTIGANLGLQGNVIKQAGQSEIRSCGRYTLSSAGELRFQVNLPIINEREGRLPLPPLFPTISGGGDCAPPAGNNIPPIIGIADGGTQQVEAGELVVMVASIVDLDDVVGLGVVWGQASGPEVSLTGAEGTGALITPIGLGGVTTSFRAFIAPQQTSQLVFEVRATDTSGGSDQATAQVQVLAPADPLAVIIAPPRLFTGESGQLDGSTSFDRLQPGVSLPPTAYRWLQLSGPPATIVSPNAAVTEFITSTPGSYVFELQVTQGVRTDLSYRFVEVEDASDPGPGPDPTDIPPAESAVQKVLAPYRGSYQLGSCDDGADHRFAINSNGSLLVDSVGLTPRSATLTINSVAATTDLVLEVGSEVQFSLGFQGEALVSFQAFVSGDSLLCEAFDGVRAPDATPAPFNVQLALLPAAGIYPHDDCSFDGEASEASAALTISGTDGALSYTITPDISRLITATTVLVHVGKYPASTYKYSIFDSDPSRGAVAIVDFDLGPGLDEIVWSGLRVSPFSEPGEYACYPSGTGPARR